MSPREQYVNIINVMNILKSVNRYTYLHFDDEFNFQFPHKRNICLDYICLNPAYFIFE